MNNLILLTWLHNIYLHPFKIKACGGLTTQTLLHLGYVTLAHENQIVCTHKGKKYLQKNIAQLHNAWLEEEKLSEAGKVTSVADFKGNDVTILDFQIHEG